MKYDVYKKALLDCVYAYDYLCKAPAGKVNDKMMVEAPPSEYWDRISIHTSTYIKENMEQIAKDLEIMQLELRLAELKK